MLRDKISQNSFLYRFSAFNIFGFALLGAAYQQGWVSTIIETDTTRITWVIGLTFLVGLVISVWKAYGLNLVANHASGLVQRIHQAPDTIALRLVAETQIIQHIANLLLLLGISGTMIGIILALKSTEVFSTADQSSTVLAIVLLFKGVYVKFYASLIGIIGHMWLATNFNMMSTLVRRVLANISEQYERPV